MDTLERYRNIVQGLLEEYASQHGDDDGVEAQTIFDTLRDHYQLAFAGWHNRRRVYGIAIHMDIKDGKVWLQHNTTEDNVAEDLVTRGIPREHIVLAFQSPFKRQYSGYAVA